ncbi:MAG: hypothetical protein EHM55_01395 [Acidobacteria bacterium]|nr:MAG: hypothetical protein EHM55_01395 [Acidobacteriota bacterium]
MMQMLDDRFLNPAWLPRLMDDASLELRLVRAAHSSAYGGTILGSVAYELLNDPDRQTLPASDVTVRISSTGFTFDTTTDADGVFLVAGVPSGHVTVTPSLPSGMTVVGAEAASGALAEGACLPLEMHAASDGAHSRQSCRPWWKAPRAALPVQLSPIDPHRVVPLDGLDFVVVW